MKHLVVIGAGGHGKVVADIARMVGYLEVTFLDDSGCPAAEGRVLDYVRYLGTADFIVAIGNSAVRQKITEELSNGGAHLVSLVHPRAAVSDSAKIGRGTVVMAGAVINADAVIGDGVIVNTCASVDHDCCVSDYVHIAVGAHICGTVTIGIHTWIGAGATVINNVNICGSCMIGAGAVVVKDIKKSGTYMGVPAGWQR